MTLPLSLLGNISLPCMFTGNGDEVGEVGVRWSCRPQKQKPTKSVEKAKIFEVLRTQFHLDKKQQKNIFFFDFDNFCFDTIVVSLFFVFASSRLVFKEASAVTPWPLRMQNTPKNDITTDIEENT